MHSKTPIKRLFGLTGSPNTPRQPTRILQGCLGLWSFACRRPPGM